MAGVDFWQRRLKEIYPNTDLSADYVMSHIFTRSAEIGRRLLRRQHSPSVDDHVIGSLSWILAISNMLEIDFKSSIVNRYPAVCSYCISKPCICDKTGMKASINGLISEKREDIDQELYWKRQTITNDNPTIDFNWIYNQITSIYPINRALIKRGAEGFVVSKMLEEGGELHRAYSQYYQRKTGLKSQISDEIADLTAWTISCWNISSRGTDLDAQFANRYAEGCPTCRRAPCACEPYSISLGHEELIRQIADELRALRKKGLQNPSVEEAIVLADDAQTKVDKGKAQGLVARIKDIAEMTRGADQASEAAVSIGSRLLRLADTFTSQF